LIRPDAPTLEHLARLGYGARGAVYCLIGALAVLGAVGSAGQAGGSSDALSSLLTKPFGRVWLGLIEVGFASFALLRIIEATADADRHGPAAKAIAVRAAYAVSEFINAGLALSTVRLALGKRSAGGDQSGQDWTAWLIRQPFGQWLMGLVGRVLIGIGLGYLRKHWASEVLRHLALPSYAKAWAVSMGRLGFAARDIVFALIGGFLILAAVQSSSVQVKNTRETLTLILNQPFGWILLAVTVTGLFAVGVLGFLQARYRRIEAADVEEGMAALKNAAAFLPRA
jgi:hypothetical protein